MAQKICRMLRVLLLAGLILALGVAPALASVSSAWINSSKAQVYLSASKTAKLSAGTKVKVKAIQNGWAQIKFNGKQGYVKVKFLTATQGFTGYVVKRARVYKSASTSSKKTAPLDVGTKLSVVGENGKFYQVTNGSALGYILKSAISTQQPSTAAIIASKVKMVGWKKGNRLLPTGDDFKIYDIQTGITFNAHRMGGTNHAEMEPVTAKDTKKLLKMDGGQFSWASRPVIVYHNGNYIPAAINTMPHGDQTITNNNFNGQFCLHLKGSKTHGTDSVNANHQAAIQYAYQWSQSF